jgi:hypothetical protein
MDYVTWFARVVGLIVRRIGATVDQAHTMAEAGSDGFYARGTTPEKFVEIVLYDNGYGPDGEYFGDDPTMPGYDPMWREERGY